MEPIEKNPDTIYVEKVAIDLKFEGVSSAKQRVITYKKFTMKVPNATTVQF